MYKKKMYSKFSRQTNAAVTGDRRQRGAQKSRKDERRAAPTTDFFTPQQTVSPLPAPYLVVLVVVITDLRYTYYPHFHFMYLVVAS
jgi:hypothetical protein